MSDEYFMTLALTQARLAALQGEVPVGAVVVRHGEVIAVGSNAMIRTHDPTAHAEVVALRAAALVLRNYRLEDCELYVTLEPCAMCTGALLNARIKRVVYGTCEPKTGAAGSVVNLFTQVELNHHTQVQGGVLSIQCLSLLQDFFRQRRLTLRKESSQRHLLRDDALRTPDAVFHNLPDYPWHPHYVNNLEALDGLRLHYLDEQKVDAGQGAKVLTYLFLHSTTGWSYEFRHFIPPLINAGHRVIIPDLIGFGKSDKPKKESFHTFNRHRKIVLELVEKLDLKNIVLVISKGSKWLSLTLPLASPKRYLYLSILENEFTNNRFPLSLGYLIWQEMQSNVPVSVDEVLSRNHNHNHKLIITENVMTTVRDIPFPDLGHQAALRAFSCMLIDEIANKNALIHNEVSEFWREQA